MSHTGEEALHSSMSTQTNIIERIYPYRRPQEYSVLSNIRLLAAVFSRDIKIKGRDGNENVA